MTSFIPTASSVTDQSPAGPKVTDRLTVLGLSGPAGPSRIIVNLCCPWDRFWALRFAASVWGASCSETPCTFLSLSFKGHRPSFMVWFYSPVPLCPTVTTCYSKLFLIRFSNAKAQVRSEFYQTLVFLSLCLIHHCPLPQKYERARTPTVTRARENVPCCACRTVGISSFLKENSC